MSLCKTPRESDSKNCTCILYLGSQHSISVLTWYKLVVELKTLFVKFRVCDSAFLFYKALLLVSPMFRFNWDLNV